LILVPTPEEKTKKVAVIQSNYVPWLGYFAVMASVDLFVVYECVQYTKNDWRNRNQLYSSDGRRTWLSIPIRQFSTKQACQFKSHDWQDFLEANNFTVSMSRRGNCYDNAVVESFYQLLKRERIKRRVYATREDARADIFDYIEMFYNPARRHGHNNGLSPVQFEKQFSVRQVRV
jgi:transposase InsO family protein